MKHLWPKTPRGRIALGLLAMLVLPYVFSRITSPWRYVVVYSTVSASAPVSAVREYIRVGCYNIAHGRGVVESNWAGGDVRERSVRLDEIAALLRQNDADVVVLNEVDFDCSWSHSVDQARYLADKAGYAYCAEQRNIDFRVLFWKWKFGNAVLSKYPITDVRVIHLPGISRVESILGGKKRAIVCEIAAPGKSIQVIGTHLSHQSEAVRVGSARMLLNIAKGNDRPTILAGDLNSTPTGFPACELDANGQNAMQTFDDSECFQRYRPILPLPTEDLTFHSVTPRMIIDWILIPANWRYLQYRTEASALSDHRPVFCDVGASARQTCRQHQLLNNAFSTIHGPDTKDAKSNSQRLSLLQPSGGHNP